MKREDKFTMPTVTMPFKWIVFLFSAVFGNIAGLVGIGIWVGTTTNTVAAHDRDIIRLRDSSKGLIKSVSRIEGILEVAFPSAARQVPKDLDGEEN